MSSPFAQAHNSKNPIKILGDLNKDGKMSSYETTRQKGMEKGMEESKGSPATQTVSKDGKSAYFSPPEKTYIKEDDPTVYNEDGSVSRFSVMQGNDRQTNGPTSEMFGAKSKKQMRYEKIAQKAENAISQNKFNKKFE